MELPGAALKLIFKVLFLIIFFLTISFPVQAALPALEASLNTQGGARQINLDNQGGLWISDFEAGEVWWVDPQTDQHSIYTTTLYPHDARRSGDYFWWADGGDIPLIGKAAVSNGAYTLWQVPDAFWLYGTAVDAAGRLWVTDRILPSLFRLTDVPASTSDELCIYALPGGGSVSYLAYRDPYLWLGDEANARLIRLNVTDNTYAWWQLPVGMQPLGMALDEQGDVWFTDQSVSRVVGELDPDSHQLTSYTEPQGLTPYMITVQGSRIWYSIDNSTKFGTLDTNVAAHVAPLGLTHGSGVAPMSHSCGSISPLAESGGSKTSPASLTWAAASYVSASPAQGWQAYTMPNKSQPWGIAYGDNKVWLADYGRQKLVEVDAPAEIVLTMEKTAIEPNYDAVGDVIHYSYELTNTVVSRLLRRSPWGMIR